MLAFVVAASWGLEFVFRLRVLRSPKRLLKTLAFAIPPFIVWDWYAISKGHWRFDPALSTGIFGPFDIPIEEYLFFFIIPIAAILTLEGVTTVLRFSAKQRTARGARA
jgi:lycopene cyclase domain-containing protein